MKLPGKVALCQGAGEVIAGQSCGAPGQLVTTFENSPELPFEDAVLHFFGGERAPLATPAYCGSYTTSAAFVPWSAEQAAAGNPGDEAAVTAHSTSTFGINEGPNHTACPGASLPFNPSLTGGSTNVNAGGFSPLTTTIGRGDGEQSMSQVTLHFPPGLSGLISNVKPCGEAEANALTLPTGKYSALTALGNVCKEKLQMPTEFVAQNGAEIKETTKVGVTGCPPTHKTAKKAKKHKKANKHGKKK